MATEIVQVTVTDSTVEQILITVATPTTQVINAVIIESEIDNTAWAEIT